MTNLSLAEALAIAAPSERAALLEGVNANEARALLEDWRFWARPAQLAPPGDWRIWLMMAGRGFGKTRAGAEWVHEIARADGDAHIALVAANLAEARAIMVEGESGLLATAKRHEKLVWLPSLRQLHWPSGAQATTYSAAEPESLRGPQHSHSWCDEIAKWDIQSGIKNRKREEKNPALAVWDNLMLGLRQGDDQRVLATTTPRPVPLLMQLMKADDMVLTCGRSIDNRSNMTPGYFAAMQASYGSSLLGRQELDGELITERQGALWTPKLIERCREEAMPPLRDMARIVIGVDPPASAHGDACGIIVVGKDEGDMAWVLADASVDQASPEQWARVVAQTFATWEADKVVAESNQGGAMVASVLRAASYSLPVKLVHASRGKAARAEPVATLYETGKVRHAGMFAALEDEMCGLMTGGGYQGPGRSPDRADALVWAMHELMMGDRGEPRIRGL